MAYTICSSLLRNGLKLSRRLRGHNRTLQVTIEKNLNCNFISKKTSVTEKSVFTARVLEIPAADLNSCHQANWVVDYLDTLRTVFDNALIASCIGFPDEQKCYQ